MIKNRVTTKIKRLILTVLFIFFVCQSMMFGQTDSLIIKFNLERSPEKKLKIAYDLSVKYLSSSPDSSAKYCRLALKDSAKVEDMSLTGNCLNVLGVSYFYLGKHSQAAETAKEALAHFKLASDKLGIAKARKNRAIALNSLGKYKEAISENLLALEYFKSVGDTIGIAGTLNDVGNIFIRLENNIRALHYLSEGLKYLKNAQNAMHINIKGNTLNSKGVIFEDLGMMDSAIYFYEQSLEFKELLGNQYSIANTRHNLCGCIDLETHPQKRINCFEELIKNQKQINNYEGIVRSKINLSISYNELGNCKKSLSVLDSALALVPLIEDHYLLMEVYRKYSFTLFECDKFKEAYVARKKYELFKDSLFNLEKQQTILELNEKYQTKQKEEEIKTLTVQQKNDQLVIQRQRLLIISIFSISLFVLTISFFLFVQYKKRQKSKKEKELQNQKEAERTRIARDMHDEIGAGLTRIVMLSEQVKMHLQSGKELKNGITDTFNKIGTESRELSYNLGEIIWALNPKNDSFDTLCAYIRSYAYDYLDDSNISCNISFPENIPTIPISPEQRRNVFLVIKEVLNNIVKHSGTEETEITLSIHEKSFSITIKDKGKGMKEDNSNSGNGLVNMAKRTKELGGTFKIESKTGEGTSITLDHIPFVKNPTKV